jgi:flagellar FliL protein
VFDWESIKPENNMASEEDLDLNPEEEEEVSGGGKKKLIIIIAAVLILGGAAAAFFLMGGDETEVSEEVTDEIIAEEEVAAEGKAEAIYVSIPSGILAQIQSGKNKMTLQVQIDMLIRNAADKDQLVKHMPVIENDLLLYFSSASAADLKTPEGKKKLREGSLKIIQDIMQQQTGKPIVESVLFTGFVMQR